MKKLLSLGLATTLALGMAIPTFAWGGGGSTTTTPTTPGGGSTTTTPGGGLEDNKLTSNLSGITVPQDAAKIELTLPNNLNGSLVLNPYGLQYTDGYAAASDERIITSKYKYIKNESTTNDLNVIWEVTGTASEGVVLEKKTPDQWTKTQATAKSVYLPVMISQTDDTDTDPTQADLKNSNANPVFVSSEMQSNRAASESSSGTKLTIAKTKYLAYGIASSTTGSNDYWDSGSWVSNGQYYTTAGDDTSDVKKDKMTEDWTANDVVNVSFVFTFEVA